VTGCCLGKGNFAEVLAAIWTTEERELPVALKRHNLSSDQVGYLIRTLSYLDAEP